ncbi:unnamed protein product [Parascedosporium putredinis]|uniref:RNA-binding protein VTS1 n=1 Tax=Parascedosporium putredinis TaxID=1442378 RepID=A0A9P1HCW7_9PEZI|nr:unnamed protein product [Parascedosporium putredinis]CAI8003758.1 unnamed protein product [Parascedosporium putredinis]
MSGAHIPGNRNSTPEVNSDKLAQQWLADIDQYETTLEEMAAATLDQDFKDELSAIEQWFRVLSEAERTAALYALLQQTTQVQIRFFIQVLQQMGKNHPMSGVLSPTGFDKDPMSNRLNDAMSKLNVESARNSIVRPSATAGKRQSGLDPSTINAMFPDAAAAIATEKAKFTQQTGNPPASNRNSTIAGPSESDSNVQNPTSPWALSPMLHGQHPMVANFNTPQANTQADMVANATAMKLAALSTVNNRFALDDVRKYRKTRPNDAQGASNPPGLGPNPQGVNLPSANVVMINEHGQVVSREHMIALQTQQGLSLGSLGHGARQVAPWKARKLEAPEDPTDPSLLQDIPAWLRSLRLHKYTDNLKELKWTELVELDDKALEDRGVNALGARRKMLKVFEQVREAKAEGRL